jgi:hypothetical protein
VGLFFRPRRPIARLAAGGLCGEGRATGPSKADLGAWSAPNWATEAPAYAPPAEAAPGQHVDDETASGAE